MRQWELSPSQTPHLSSSLYEPTSLSQPTCCVCVRACVCGGERERTGTVNCVNPTPRPDNYTMLGKSCHEKKLQTSGFFFLFSSLMMKHVGSVPRHSRNGAKTQSSCPAVIKLSTFMFKVKTETKSCLCGFVFSNVSIKSILGTLKKRKL